ncbi:MAG: KamA family radical SAM protein [Candidatus Rhabdochlamydia sp.]
MALHWRQIQRDNFTDVKKLLVFLELEEKNQEIIDQKSQFPLNLPLRLAKKIEKNNILDPVFLQFVPLKQEQIKTQGFCSDPVGDELVLKTPKLLHKYQGRALLVLTSHCVMNCRFCFRQHFPYEKKLSLFEEELRCIKEDPSIEEVILSGGDPLSLPDYRLEELLTSLSVIPHVKKIRFHTRFPLGIPERLDTSFLTLIASLPTQIVFVIHVNHVNELDDDILLALKRVQKIGIPVLSQTVLLKGVNDNLSSLKQLFSCLTNHGIMPYYLHQLDRVQGGAHFEVSEETGLHLISELKKCLPGYAVPKYVQEIKGHTSKTEILAPSTSFPVV